MKVTVLTLEDDDDDGDDDSDDDSDGDGDDGGFCPDLSVMVVDQVGWPFCPPPC